MIRDLEAPRCGGYYFLGGQASITSAAGRFGGVGQGEVKVNGAGTASADGAEQAEAVGSMAERISGGNGRAGADGGDTATTPLHPANV